MAPFGGTYNPSAVMMNRSPSAPYIWSGKGATPPPLGGKEGSVAGGTKPAAPRAGATPAAAPVSPTNVLAPESIRATGSGPFDASYRQNLATYAGGQFGRPGGQLSFNPTDPTTFPGQPVGGGNAPLPGLPTSLMDAALGGQGFSYTPPPVAQTAQPAPQYGGLQNWLDQFMRNGRGLRFGVNSNG